MSKTTTKSGVFFSQNIFFQTLYLLMKNEKFVKISEKTEKVEKKVNFFPKGQKTRPNQVFFVKFLYPSFAYEKWKKHKFFKKYQKNTSFLTKSAKITVFSSLLKIVKNLVINVGPNFNIFF